MDTLDQSGQQGHDFESNETPYRLSTIFQENKTSQIYMRNS